MGAHEEGELGIDLLSNALKWDHLKHMRDMNK